MKRISFEEPEFTTIVFSSNDVYCGAFSGGEMSTGDGEEMVEEEAS